MSYWTLDGNYENYYDYSRGVVKGGNLELVLTMDVESRCASIKPRILGGDDEPDIPALPVEWEAARTMLGDVPFAHIFERIAV